MTYAMKEKSKEKEESRARARARQIIHVHFSLHSFYIQILFVLQFMSDVERKDERNHGSVNGSIASIQ